MAEPEELLLLLLLHCTLSLPSPHFASASACHDSILPELPGVVRAAESESDGSLRMVSCEEEGKEKEEDAQRM